MNRTIAIALALATTAACQADWSLRGHVVSAEAVDAISGAPAPIAFAKVILHCPGGADVVAQADRSGAFELAGVGEGPSLRCTVEASAPGRSEWVASVDEICADDGEGQGRCANGAMVAPLARAE